MQKKRLLILFSIVLFILGSYLVSSICTLTLDATTYVQGETSEVDGICSSPNEKSQTYTIDFANSSGFVIYSVTGTTPSVKNTLFSETFTINSTYVTSYGDMLNVTLSGNELEGADNASISVAGKNNLIITDIVQTSQFLVGKFGALDFKVTESNGDAISNAQCIIDIVDENDLPLSPAGGKPPVPSQGDGKVLYSIFFDETFVKETKTYKWDIACTCFNSSGVTSAEIGICDDGTNGQRIGTFKHGETQFPFTIDSYLTVNTVTDKSEYYPRQTIFICANVTNSRTTRTPLHIFHQVRCSAGEDNNTDLDRSLIMADGFDYDERGISANTTQMQCKEFVIPEIRHLEGRSSECYATTTTWVISGKNEKIKAYTTTSSVFNITSDTINLPVDWKEIAENKFLAVINLSASEYGDWNGTGTGTIDIFLNSLKGESFDPKTTRSLPQIDFSSFLGIRQIKEIIVWNSTNSISHNLEFLEDGHLEIEINNQDISPNGWYNITIEFEDFEERSTGALEGINSSAGTFDFSILAFNSDSDMVLVRGKGKTGEGQIMNRDAQIKCEVDGHPSTRKVFETFVTDTFSFEEFIEVNLPYGMYTMSCQALDQQFGTFVTKRPVEDQFELTGFLTGENPASPIKKDQDLITNETINDTGIIKEITTKGAKLIETIKSKLCPILIVVGVIAIGGTFLIIFFVGRLKPEEEDLKTEESEEIFDG